MPAETLQVSRAITVIPSDNADIPYPQSVSTGSNTSTTSLKLINSNAKFITNGVKPGDIVYNLTSSTAATVVSVDSETQLTLNANIFTGTGRSYVVYQQGNNRGCVFYTGGAGNLNVVTAGGDSILISGAVAGQYHPVHIKKILSTSTSASLIIAYW
jgi:hypothetical protein